MRITYQLEKGLALIYVYLREFDGNIVSTISDVRTNIFYDIKDNWIGFEIFNDTFEGKKIDLPLLNKPHNSKLNEYVSIDKEKIVVIFEDVATIHRKKQHSCNIDFNVSGGLQGTEFIIPSFDGNMNIAMKFSGT